MTTIFPAPPGSYLVERHPDEKQTKRTPVIGYYHVQGAMAFPICAIAHGGLTRYRALMTPDGFVTDASVGLVFESLPEWEKVADSEGYKTMKLSAAVVTEVRVALPVEEPEDQVEEQPESESRMDPKTAEKLAPAGKTLNNTRLPDKPKGKPQLFQTTSFWRIAGQDAIFMVEGGVEAPAKNDTTFEKIKRDDYQAMKRAGATVRDWPLVDDGSAAAGEAEDDEDDGSGLI